eukprot:660360-Rhodomonas_salina.1
MVLQDDRAVGREPEHVPWVCLLLLASCTRSVVLECASTATCYTYPVVLMSGMVLSGSRVRNQTALLRSAMRLLVP